jgi:hypothetical protein
MEILINAVVPIIIALITYTISPILITYFKKKIKPKENTNLYFTKVLQIKQKINELLIEIRILSGANRVSLIEFHNGGQSLTLLPFYHASMMYETTDIHTKELISRFQKIPISLISKMLLNMLESNKIFNNSDNSDLKEINEFYKSFGIEKLLNILLTNNIQNGMLSINWDKDVELNIDDVLEKINPKIYSINLLLNELIKLKDYTHENN